MLVITRATLC